MRFTGWVSPVLWLLSVLSCVVLVRKAAAGTTAYGIYGGMPCEGGLCKLEFPSDYYNIDQVMARQIESTIEGEPPIVKLNVFIVPDFSRNPLLCILRTGTPEAEMVEEAANKGWWRVPDVLSQRYCWGKITYLKMTQKYNISMTHPSNDDNPMGLSTTPDGLWATGGTLFEADHTQYTLDTLHTQWGPYKQLYKAARQRAILIQPEYLRQLYFFSAAGHGRGGTIEVVQ